MYFLVLHTHTSALRFHVQLTAGSSEVEVALI